MSQSESLHGRYRSFVADLTGALDANDEAAFRGAFERLRGAFNVELNPELKRLTENARSALRRFREEARIDALAAEEVPDARKRLAHVVKLTDEAAHTTLDLIDKTGPIIEHTTRAATQLLAEWSAGGPAELASAAPLPERVHAFVERARSDAELVRGFLSQMLLAQGYQDLTGQIIRSVIALVGELETVLGQLVALANGEDTRRMPALTPVAKPEWQRGAGPQVPGTSTHDSVGGQDDIDALIASMAGGQ
ncbi:MAG TPA: protein phosphatase CheZ [Steroidobacteraceae bacterium]|nr:protein phosphatase CheZ [Steroidobacteraceae bacterium]